MKFTTKILAAILAIVGVGSALAQDIKVGVTVSATGGRYALATMCIGVGQGIALLVERV